MIPSTTLWEQSEDVLQEFQFEGNYADVPKPVEADVSRHPKRKGPWWACFAPAQVNEAMPASSPKALAWRLAVTATHLLYQRPGAGLLRLPLSDVVDVQLNWIEAGGVKVSKVAVTCRQSGREPICIRGLKDPQPLVDWLDSRRRELVSDADSTPPGVRTQTPDPKGSAGAGVHPSTGTGRSGGASMASSAAAARAVASRAIARTLFSDSPGGGAVTPASSPGTSCGTLTHLSPFAKGSVQQSVAPPSTFPDCSRGPSPPAGDLQNTPHSMGTSQSPASMPHSAGASRTGGSTAAALPLPPPLASESFLGSAAPSTGAMASSSPLPHAAGGSPPPEAEDSVTAGTPLTSPRTPTRAASSSPPLAAEDSTMTGGPVQPSPRNGAAAPAGGHVPRDGPTRDVAGGLLEANDAALLPQLPTASTPGHADATSQRKLSPGSTRGSLPSSPVDLEPLPPLHPRHASPVQCRRRSGAAELLELVGEGASPREAGDGETAAPSEHGSSARAPRLPSPHLQQQRPYEGSHRLQHRSVAGSRPVEEPEAGAVAAEAEPGRGGSDEGTSSFRSARSGEAPGAPATATPLPPPQLCSEASPAVLSRSGSEAADAGRDVEDVEHASEDGNSTPEATSSSPQGSVGGVPTRRSAGGVSPEDSARGFKLQGSSGRMQGLASSSGANQNTPLKEGGFQLSGGALGQKNASTPDKGVTAVSALGIAAAAATVSAVLTSAASAGISSIGLAAAPSLGGAASVAAGSAAVAASAVAAPFTLLGITAAAAVTMVAAAAVTHMRTGSPVRPAFDPCNEDVEEARRLLLARNLAAGPAQAASMLGAVEDASAVEAAILASTTPASGIGPQREWQGSGAMDGSGGGSVDSATGGAWGSQPALSDAETGHPGPHGASYGHGFPRSPAPGGDSGGGAAPQSMRQTDIGEEDALPVMLFSDGPGGMPPLESKRQAQGVTVELPPAAPRVEEEWPANAGGMPSPSGGDRISDSGMTKLDEKSGASIDAVAVVHGGELRPPVQGAADGTREAAAQAADAAGLAASGAAKSWGQEPKNDPIVRQLFRDEEGALSNAAPVQEPAAVPAEVRSYTFPAAGAAERLDSDASTRPLAAAANISVGHVQASVGWRRRVLQLSESPVQVLFSVPALPVHAGFPRPTAAPSQQRPFCESSAQTEAVLAPRVECAVQTEVRAASRKTLPPGSLPAPLHAGGLIDAVAYNGRAGGGSHSLDTNSGCSSSSSAGRRRRSPPMAESPAQQVYTLDGPAHTSSCSAGGVSVGAQTCHFAPPMAGAKDWYMLSPGEDGPRGGGLQGLAGGMDDSIRHRSNGTSSSSSYHSASFEDSSRLSTDPNAGAVGDCATGPALPLGPALHRFHFALHRLRPCERGEDEAGAVSEDRLPLLACAVGAASSRADESRDPGTPESTCQGEAPVLAGVSSRTACSVAASAANGASAIPTTCQAAMHDGSAGSRSDYSGSSKAPSSPSASEAPSSVATGVYSPFGSDQGMASTADEGGMHDAAASFASKVGMAPPVGLRSRSGIGVSSAAASRLREGADSSNGKGDMQMRLLTPEEGLSTEPPTPAVLRSLLLMPDTANCIGRSTCASGVETAEVSTVAAEQAAALDAASDTAEDMVWLLKSARGGREEGDADAAMPACASGVASTAVSPRVSAPQGGHQGSYSGPGSPVAAGNCSRRSSTGSNGGLAAGPPRGHGFLAHAEHFASPPAAFAFLGSEAMGPAAEQLVTAGSAASGRSQQLSEPIGTPELGDVVTQVLPPSPELSEISSATYGGAYGYDSPRPSPFGTPDLARQSEAAAHNGFGAGMDAVSLAAGATAGSARASPMCPPSEDVYHNNPLYRNAGAHNVGLRQFVQGAASGMTLPLMPSLSGQCYHGLLSDDECNLSCGSSQGFLGYTASQLSVNSEATAIFQNKAEDGRDEAAERAATVGGAAGGRLPSGTSGAAVSARGSVSDAGNKPAQNGSLDGLGLQPHPVRTRMPDASAPFPGQHAAPAGAQKGPAMQFQATGPKAGAATHLASPIMVLNPMYARSEAGASSVGGSPYAIHGGVPPDYGCRSRLSHNGAGGRSPAAGVHAASPLASRGAADGSHTPGYATPKQQTRSRVLGSPLGTGSCQGSPSSQQAAFAATLLRQANNAVDSARDAVQRGDGEWLSRVTATLQAVQTALDALREF